jgi:hypothetical protein
MLLLQLLQTNKNQRALMQQGRSARIIEVMLKGTDPNVSETVSRAILRDTTLNAPQVYALNVYARSLFWGVEDSFLQHRAGLLDEASWATDVATLNVVLTAPAYRVAWKMSRRQASDEYREYVDSLMNDVKVGKPFDELAAWKALMAKELETVV